MEPETRTWSLRELFEIIRTAALTDLPPDALIAKFLDYCPSLLISAGTPEQIVSAVRAIRKSARPTDRFFFSGRYEDHREFTDCCVVLTLELQGSGMKQDFCVGPAWLEEIGKISDHLLERSVALTLQSSYNGLTCEFRLPVHHPGAHPPQHRDTILLVEDEVFVRNSTREVLAMAGHRVVESANAEEALQLFRKKLQSIALVIADVTLPGMSGRELAFALHRRAPRLPVLLISGYFNGEKEECRENLHRLPKPFNSTALLSAVHGCLHLRHEANRAILKTEDVRETIGFC